jgi:UDP-2-acetamido-3-amino-2,3-dideoxy-glucuronate N-acetyltransferase
MIHPTATVEHPIWIGQNTNIWHYAHIRAHAMIGEGCTIGKDVFVDSHVRIGNRCKIQNGVSIYRGVTLEDEVFVGPNVTFTNDKHPRAVGEWEIAPTYLKRGASIGAGAILVAGITIGEYAMIGAGAVVTHDVRAHALVYGNPAHPEGYVCPKGHRLTTVHASSSYECVPCQFILR